jgi:hypothetical protein
MLARIAIDDNITAIAVPIYGVRISIPLIIPKTIKNIRG